MRLLLSLVAVAVLTVSVGCAPEETKPVAEKPTESPASAPVETEGETAEPAAETTETESAGEFQTVSLKLPGMT